ncbi:uncharacterized [Tachysurus ichikawai]
MVPAPSHSLRFSVAKPGSVSDFQAPSFGVLAALLPPSSSFSSSSSRLGAPPQTPEHKSSPSAAFFFSKPRSYFRFSS